MTKLVLMSHFPKTDVFWKRDLKLIKQKIMDLIKKTQLPIGVSPTDTKQGRSFWHLLAAGLVDQMCRDWCLEILSSKYLPEEFGPFGPM